jgi:peptide/nickel transport system substrate-binding protein
MVSSEIMMCLIRFRAPHANADSRLKSLITCVVSKLRERGGVSRHRRKREMDRSDSSYWTRIGGHRTSRRNVIRGGGIATAGLFGAALIGCGDDEPTPGATPATAPGAATPAATPATPDFAAKQGGSLPTHSAVPGTDTRDPIVGTWEGHQLSGEHVYDRLLSSRPDERVYVLDAAESIELPDPLTVVAKLKPGQVYQDLPPVNGRPVVAQDIVEMQFRARDESQAHNRSFQLSVMDTAEAPDDNTVVWRLQKPYAYIFSSQALGYAGNMAIVPSELSTGDLHTMKPVGSGPYMEGDVQLQVRYQYLRNPTYRRADEGMPFIDERIRIPMSDNSAIEAAFRGGASLVWGQQGGAISWDIADRVIADMGDRIDADEYFSLGPFTLNMSSRRDKYRDERVREAFYRAFDPAPFIELNLSGRGVPVPGVVPVSLSPYQVDWDDQLPSGRTIREAKRHDMAEASALLDAAGFDLNQTIEMSTIAGPISETALQIWERTLRDLGFRSFSYAKVLPFGEWVESVSNTGDYDFVATGHPAEDVPPRMLRLHHSTTGYIHQSFNIGDPEIDAVIEASEGEIDFQRHTELVKEAQRLLIDKHAHMFYVYTAEAVHLKHAVVKDWELNPGLMVMQRPEAWMDV